MTKQLHRELVNIFMRIPDPQAVFHVHNRFSRRLEEDELIEFTLDDEEEDYYRLTELGKNEFEKWKKDNGNEAKRKESTESDKILENKFLQFIEERKRGNKNGMDCHI